MHILNRVLSQPVKPHSIMQEGLTSNDHQVCILLGRVLTAPLLAALKGFARINFCREAVAFSKGGVGLVVGGRG